VPLRGGAETAFLVQDRASVRRASAMAGPLESGRFQRWLAVGRWNHHRFGTKSAGLSVTTGSDESNDAIVAGGEPPSRRALFWIVH
jgi:hypothetical protein